MEMPFSPFFTVRQTFSSSLKARHTGGPWPLHLDEQHVVEAVPVEFGQGVQPGLVLPAGKDFLDALLQLVRERLYPLCAGGHRSGSRRFGGLCGGSLGLAGTFSVTSSLPLTPNKISALRNFSL